MSHRPPIAADGRGRRIAIVAAMAMGQALAAGLAAFATRDVFGALHSGAPLPAPALIGIALAGCTIAGLRVAERAMAERVGCDYAAAVREKLFLHVARLPPSVIANRTRGGLALRFVGDLAAVRNWVSRGLVRLLSAVIALPSSVLVLALLDWRLAMAAGVPLAIGLAVLAALGGPLHDAHTRLRRKRSRLAVGATERLSHGAALRLVGLVSRERRRLADRARALADASTAHARLAGTATALPDAVSGIAATAILAVSAANGVAPAVAAGALAALSLTIQPLRLLADVRDRFEAWRVASGKIDQTLQTPSLPERTRNRATPDLTQPALSVEPNGAGKAGGTLVTVGRGETCEIEDDGGAASTLLLCAAGIEQAPHQRIRVFGHPPARVATGTTIYIGAASPILRGSLRQNLLLGVSGSQSDAALLAALACVGLDKTAARIGGLGGRIAESGRNLGRLERLRLLSARAVLSNVPLILIDAAGLALPDHVLNEVVEALRRPDAAIVIAKPRPWQQTPPNSQSGRSGPLFGKLPSDVGLAEQPAIVRST